MKNTWQKIAKEGPVSIQKAVTLLKQAKRAKFDETVEIHMWLGVDSTQSDQLVRGTVPLPHGSGKTVRVLVFAKSGPSADAARGAGAEYVGFDDMIKQCQDGWSDFDVAIATPEAMSEVRKLGKVLGPRGLMPNPKDGTVTTDIARTIKELKAGKVSFRAEKNGGLVQMAIGKLSFEDGVSGPGRYVELRAEMDILVLVSNCPQLNNPCNAYNPTPVEVLIWES